MAIDQDEKINISPLPMFLNAVREQMTFCWKTVLGELIDNCLDARATSVSAEFGTKRFTISDNGCGMKDVLSAVQLGNRHQHEGETLGRYGVGLKDSAIMLWGTTSIVSTRDGIRSRLDVVWPDLANGDQWKINAPEFAATSNASGTVIEFRDIARGINKRGYESLKDHLEWMFFNRPRNSKIEISRGGVTEQVGRMKRPAMTEDVISKTIEINGKTAELEVGIVKDINKNPHFGLTYIFGHRSIMRTCQGLGGANDRYIFGTVKLSSNWVLEKNKRKITDPDLDELEVLIYEAASPIIQKSTEQSESIESDAFHREVEDTIQQTLSKGRKEKRDKGESHGTAEPKDTGRTRTPKKTQPATRSSRLLTGKIEFRWYASQMPDDNGCLSVGYFDPGGPRIYLNESVPFLANARQDKNVACVVMAAVSVLAASHVEAQRMLPFKGNTAIDIMSEVIGNMPRKEG